MTVGDKKCQNDGTQNVNTFVRDILEYPSIILTPTDISLATRHISAITRKQVIKTMIEAGLLQEDNYLVRQFARKVAFARGFVKKVPPMNDETARYNFLRTLNEFRISWDDFKSFFDLTKAGLEID